MIISHKYRFIFIKTRKTAGTSIEVFLSQLCGPDDVLTPINPPIEPHVPRNWRGLWNPVPELIDARFAHVGDTTRALGARRKYYNHMSARLVRCRAPRYAWNGYFKFCVERNPWDKTLSHYYMHRTRAGGELSLDEYLTRGGFCRNARQYTDRRGQLMVDRVVRFESLDRELGEVFGQLGIPFSGDLGVRAKSEHRPDRRPYQQVFSAAQREVVAHAFAREIEMHHYEF